MFYDLEEECKKIEKLETSRMFMPYLPILARIDGRSFHTYTKGLNRPFDEGMIKLMQETTKFLVQETNARIGYTQSDEITLLFYTDAPKAQLFFNGKIFKMVSQLASIATAYFNANVPKYIPSHVNKLAFFDCRCWQVPRKADAVNIFLWRELDATRNSIEGYARSFYSDKECFKKNQSALQEMIFKKGYNWNDLSSHIKRGSYIRREVIKRKLTAEEISHLTPMHECRKNPDKEVIRHSYNLVEMPPLNRIINKHTSKFSRDMAI
jgi:tRNA(His) 5'-end guanylyltransferase